MMLALSLAVVAASVVGSLHCAGMCGPFLAFALGLNEPGVSRAKAQAAYHLGRLTTYAALGAVAGLLGHALDLSGKAVGLKHAAVILAGATMVVFGAAALARAAGHRPPTIRPPRFVAAAFRRGCDAAMRIPPLHRAAAVGLLTTLLPCGWLYSFALVAAGTGRPECGALVMAAFWLGTLPVMVTLGAGVQAVSGPLRRAVPAVMALVIIALGLGTLVNRAGVSLSGLEATARAAGETSVRAETSGGAPSRNPAFEALDRIGAQPLPCCAAGAAPEPPAGQAP
jgi:sulfite exporter TauE/SafE